MSGVDRDARAAAGASPGHAREGLPALGDVPFQAILEAMREGVALLDRDWRFRYLNEVGARNFGGTRDSLIGVTIFDHYRWLRGTPLHQRLEASAAAGEPDRLEAPFEMPDGSTRWLELSVQPSADGVLVLSLDVTDRHADANARLLGIFESADLIAVILDPAGRLTFASNALFRTTGWSAEEVLGADWFNRFAPEGIRADLRAQFRRALREGRVPRQHEHGLVTRDGRERTVVWSNTVLRDAAGEVVGVSSVGDDVTDRRAAEATSRESAVAMAAALDVIRDTIVLCRPVLDAEGRFADAEVVHLNAGAGERWLPGVPADQIRGRRLFEILPAARESIGDVYRAVVETREPQHVVRSFATPAGDRVMDVTVTPHGDGFIHVGRDITDLQRAGAELREREEELRRTLGSVDAFVAWSPRRGAPLTVSPPVARILGWSPEEISSFSAWEALIHPDDLPSCVETWAGEPEEWTLQYRMRRRDGTYAWVHDRGRRVIDPLTGERGIFGVVVDVGDRVAAGAALAASEERLRQIVGGVDAIVAFQERDGTGLELSPQLERILGWRPEEVPDFDAWRALVHPDDLPRCMEVWSDEPPTWELEYRMRRADGGWALVADRGRRVPSQDGRGMLTFGIVVDVTERHRADEALRRSEERLRRIVEGVDGMISYQEASGEPVVLSPQTQRILGYPPETMAPFDVWQSLVHPDDLPRLLAVWDADSTGWDMEYRMRRADGVWIWVNDRARRILHADGRRPGLFGFITDVTPQHEAADRLRASEARYRAVTDSAVDAIITIDDAGRIVSWNPSAEQLFGVGPDGLRDRPVTLLMPAAHIPGHEAPGHRLGQGDGAPTTGHLTQLEGRRADGSVFPIELSLAGWAVDGKRYTTAIIRDVTERRNAEEAVRVSAAFQRSVLDAMAEGLLIVGPSGRIASANVRASQILGIEPERLTGSRVGEGWHLLAADGAELDPRDGPAQTALSTGQPRRDVEIGTLRPDGNRVWIRINSEPLRDRDGTVIASVSTFSDITAERALAEQLRHSQRLETVGQLAGGVAHDFNNLLAAIRGYGELALSSLPAESQASDDVGEVLRAADRAAALTRQLLLFGRRQVLAPRPVDAADVVDGLIPMLRQLVGEHIVLEATRDAPGTVVRADPGQLEQVILNLVVNARDAIPGGGRIDVTTRRVEPDDPAVAPSARPAWPAVRITVADTGQGIDPVVLPHIFEPFYTTKEAGRGSGMGLATVYGVIGAFGGTVSVATSPGRGSTFTVDLPRFESPAEGEQAGMAVAAAGPAPVAGRQGTVLLVEDDAAVRAILGRQLEGLGWRVEAHPSGTAAAAAVAVGNQARPDLVVTDVRMPGLQGPELARRLRAVWPELPVVFVTGLADEVDFEPRSPRVHVLTKPFNRDELARAIDQAIGMPG